jgi:hypothetical protein
VSRLGQQPGRKLSEPVTAAAAELSALLADPAAEQATAESP